MFGIRFWAVSLAFSMGTALIIGIPTVLIPNSFYTRMVPTSPQDYVIWVLSVVLLGPVLALAFLFPDPASKETLRAIGSGNIRAASGGILSFLSVGCPICNKIIVALLGVSGAMSIFNPIRPFLGIAAVVILAVTLYLRVQSLRHGCALPTSRMTPADTSAR
jgi:predicted membrane protein